MLSAVGFDWTFDRPPDQCARPLVHATDGRWSEEAFSLRDSHTAIRDAMLPVAEAQGAERLRVLVQEEGAQAPMRRRP